MTETVPNTLAANRLTVSLRVSNWKPIEKCPRKVEWSRDR